MVFRINSETRGTDRSDNRLENVLYSPIDDWSIRILQGCKSICPDNSDKMNLEILKSGNPSFAPENKEALKCLIKSFEKNIPQMPQEIQPLFNDLLRDMQRQNV